jgi:hypothetical protein
MMKSKYAAKHCEKFLSPRCPMLFLRRGSFHYHLEDSSASLRCVNPTLNIYPDATASFLKPGDLAYYRDCLSIRAMPNGERSRLWGIARLRFEINPALQVTGTAMEKLCSPHGSLQLVTAQRFPLWLLSLVLDCEIWLRIMFYAPLATASIRTVAFNRDVTATRTDEPSPFVTSLHVFGTMRAFSCFGHGHLSDSEALEGGVISFSRIIL